MEVEYTISNIQKKTEVWNKMGLTIGFVPTMGYLHSGHASLIKKARDENDKVVISIFVNPTQFAKGEDLEVYPRDFEKDTSLCQSLGVDMIFYPKPEEIYPKPFFTTIGLPELSKNLCGRSRPTHFEGVCIVVAKLFNIVMPTNAYFGQKDYQQFIIIKTMVKDLNLGINVVLCPTIREESGLALSSRNAYLTDEEKQVATTLYSSLFLGKTLLENGEKSAVALIKQMKEKLNAKENIKIDYIQVVDPTTLENIETINGSTLIALAIYIGNTRLIDNIIIK